MRTAVLLCLLLAACGQRSAARPNVLLVTIDTLRPDAIGKGTPALDAFLRDATRFRGARTVTPLTLPAHTSMFTGLFPRAHGIHDNVTEPLPPRAERPFPLLAEQMRDAGYTTAAFVSRAVLAAPTGIRSGFDTYDCPATDDLWKDEGGYVPGEERIRAALAWIEGVPPGQPWFAWVHLFDPHAPYRAFAGDAERAPTRESDPPAVRYAGEVRRADAALARLLAEVGADTVVVLASDHGESLGEHAEPTHGPLCYGSTIDAVLAVRAPGFGRGKVDTTLRSVADIAPTLRRLCDLPAFDGDGRDLAGAPHGTLVAESLFAWGIHGWGQSFAVTDGRFSLVESGPTLELFDREADPGETTPLPLRHPAYEKLDRALERYRGASAGGSGGGADLVASVLPYAEARQAGAGYLPRHENAKLLNPRDHLKAWDTLNELRSLFQICVARRDPQPLERGLRTLDAMEKTTKSPQIDHYRALFHAATADLTGATPRYREAAWAEIAAIEKGLTGNDVIGAAIRYCVAGSDAEALRALAGILRRRGSRLDPEIELALEAAAKQLEQAPPQPAFALGG